VFLCFYFNRVVKLKLHGVLNTINITTSDNQVK